MNRRKKSKFKALKTRLFGKSKRAGGEENTKLSQSVSDISAGKGLGSDEDLVCSQGIMGSRALSHESIFLTGHVLTDAEPARDSSQQNVHSKIKALQLLQQKLHFGPPPAVLPIKRPEDLSSHSEDCLDHSPPDGSREDTTSQPASCPFSPFPKSLPTKSLPPTPSHSFSLFGPTISSSSTVESPLDFNTPAQFTPCLDTSAARHRMAVKPRNQRASTKRKLTVVSGHTFTICKNEQHIFFTFLPMMSLSLQTQSLSLSHTLNNVDHLKSVDEQEQELDSQEEVTVETEHTTESQHLPSKYAEVAPVTSEVAPILSEVTSILSEVAPVTSEVAPIPSEVTSILSEVAPIPSEVAPVTSEVAPVTSELASVASGVAAIPSQLAPVTPDAAPKPPSLSFPHQDHPLPGIAPSVLRVKPRRPLDAMSSKRPHSSYIESELKGKREADFEIQLMSHDKRSTLNKAGVAQVPPDPLSSTFNSMVMFRSSSVRQQVQAEGDSTRGIRRPAPGSGSFHLSISTARNQDGERPRSGSFVGVLEQTEAKHKPVGGIEDKSVREKEEIRGLQPRGGPFGVGRLRQEEPRSTVFSWDKRDSFKKVEPVTPSKRVPADTGAVEREEVESSQEEVEEAVEAKEVQEEEGKTAFGIKLRSTSQSVRLRSNPISNHHSKTVLCEDQSEKQKQQETRDSANFLIEKLAENVSFTPTNLGEPRPRGES
uniref:DUF4592 domain-containing protein n=1 Tax=Stegastes partitus TaxID=144197 RepID=A0A3B5AZI9_9TELE